MVLFFNFLQSLDIVPTILDLVGIRRIPVLCPSGRLCPDFEGKSLATVIRIGPGAKVSGQSFAISQLRRCPYLKTETPRANHPEDKWAAICSRKHKESGSVMGYSLRTSQWRYTAWFHYDNDLHRPFLERSLLFEELYDHRSPHDLTDLEGELENLLRCRAGTCVSISAEVMTIREGLMAILYDYLATKMNYSMKEALNRTRETYSRDYVLNGNRAIRLAHIMLFGCLFKCEPNQVYTNNQSNDQIIN